MGQNSSMKQTEEPSYELDEETRAAAERIRERGGPAADLCDVLIQLDEAASSD
jgi:hypothetical protein